MPGPAEDWPDDFDFAGSGWDVLGGQDVVAMAQRVLDAIFAPDPGPDHPGVMVLLRDAP